ncbi:hypothetical protein BCU94_17460 [Shewanella sp. 10N.286.52.C2]|uniref:DUF2855 family protein n=1 Tax=Shewanella sp. 10N.286.52.C2 TaxID=1880838 RepID=UPI000C84A4C5|nr:DUF2855 family protein [Shewanella sp. 10N.286.52.C2]PMG28470.1 hypothetical protein BCU94_17460 [Shewanella sp. 10N.286.52.C2]
MTQSQTLTHSAFVFEVSKSNLIQTRVVPLSIEQPLAENELLLKVDKFALTANNISYGVTGDALGYWRFFPTANSTEQAQWGRLPVMGYADVIASNCQHIKVGERLWGFMPMATHLKVIAGNITTTGFSDMTLCREGLSPVYSRFDRISASPFYQVNNEDFDILLRGLFTTSWLVDDFMFDNNYFDAAQYLITSASSKTSIALAFSIKDRGERPAIGITSESNRKFVESLACYDQVVSYQQIASLDSGVTSILVDMAGGQSTLSAIHYHFADSLRYSCRIGATHHQDIDISDGFNVASLPGAKPEFFFAPNQLKKRAAEYGATEMMNQMNLALLRYIEFCRVNITINTTENVNELDAIYQQVLAGKADASVGQIVSW